MAAQTTPFTIIFPQWYDDRCEEETPAKGYLSDVEVRLEDGSRYKLYFTDPVRLQQTLEDDAASGRPYCTEPGLVVLPEVTTQAIEQAVPGLLRDGYFRHLKPIPFQNGEVAMDSSERAKLELAEEMIRRAVAESQNVKAADKANEDRLKAVRTTLLDAGEQIKQLLGPD